MAKRMLLRKALPILLMSTGLDDIAEIANEILQHLSGSSDVS